MAYPCFILAQGIGKNPDGTKYKYGDYQTKKDPYNYSAKHPSSTTSNSNNSTSSSDNYKELYDEVGNFNDGLAPVKKKNKYNGSYKYGYINREGTVIIPLEYDYVHDFFHDGLVGVQKDNKMGFIDMKGNIVIPLIYDYCFYFIDNFAEVKLKGETFKIDKNGKRVGTGSILPQYSNSKVFHEGLASVSLNGKWGYIDQTDKVIIPIKYDEASAFSEGLATVRIGNKWGYVDKVGKEITPVKYDFVYDYSEDLAIVIINNKSGFIDKAGNEIISIKFDRVYGFTDGLAAVKINNKWGFVDKIGTVKISIKYDDVYKNFSQGFAEVKQNGITFKIDKTGKKVL